MSGFGIFLCCEIVKWGLYYRLHESLGYCISLNFLIRQKTITCDTLFSLWIPLYHCDDDKVEDDCKMLRIRRSFPRDCTFAPSRCLRLLHAAIHSSHLLIISIHHGVEFYNILSRRHHHHQLHHCPGYSSSHLSDTQTHSSLQGAAETTHLFATLSPFSPEI